MDYVPVTFDELLDNWKKCTTRIESKLKVDLEYTNKQAVDVFLDSSLKHF